MTASSVSSSYVTAITAQPRTVLSRANHAAPMHTIAGTLEVATTSIDEIGDIIHLVELPFSAKVREIYIFSDDLDSNGTPALAYDLGLYQLTLDGTFTVLDADAYASAITIGQSANTTTMTNQAFEARNIDKINNTVVQDAVVVLTTGVPVQGSRAILSMTMTAAAATAVAGTISFLVKYSM